MTLTTIIILNVVLDVALLAGLAYVMSHAAKLTPHRPGVSDSHRRPRRPLREHSRAHGERVSPRLTRAFD
jgi:hypothetical protein